MEPIERRLGVARSARYFLGGDLAADGTPARDARELWFVLHGYGQLAAPFQAEFACVERPGLVLVAPEGLSRYYLERGTGAVGASWMTKEAREDEIADTLRFLDAVHAEVSAALAGAPRVIALGFSQGAAAACRWAALGAARVDHVVSWAGGVPPDLDPSLLAAHDLSLVAGTRDAFLDERRLALELERLRDVPHRLLRFEGGHRLDRDLLRELADGFAGPR